MRSQSVLHRPGEGEVSLGWGKQREGEGQDADGFVEYLAET